MSFEPQANVRSNARCLLTELGDGTGVILDLDTISSEVRYDDPDRTYPHIYGPLNTDAVIGELSVRRDAEGTFLAIGPA